MKLTKGRLVIMAALLLILATITGLVAVTLVQAADFREENIQKVWLNGVLVNEPRDDPRQAVAGDRARSKAGGRLQQRLVRAVRGSLRRHQQARRRRLALWK